MTEDHNMKPVRATSSGDAERNKGDKIYSVTASGGAISDSSTPMTAALGRRRASASRDRFRREWSVGRRRMARPAHHCERSVRAIVGLDRRFSQEALAQAV